MNAAFMEAALTEARKAFGRTGPNPCVGAVVVVDGAIVARGYHAKAGQPHAEIAAMADARARGLSLVGATIYVTLEPCNHTGRTGPCTEALIAAGIGKVVYGCSDPNPLVAGAGIARLRAASVSVEGPLLEAQARALIADFALAVRTKRPWVIAKLACSIDGHIATQTGESKWITSDDSRRIGRGLRASSQAIAVGVSTIVADNPSLTVRDGVSPDPLRVIFDSTLRTPASAAALPDAVIVTSAQSTGPNVWSFAGRRPPVREAIERLYSERGIMRLLVEGGPTLIGSFRDAGLIDELHLFIAPVVFGGDAPASVGGEGVQRIVEAARMRLESLQRVGDDIHAVYLSS